MLDQNVLEAVVVGAVLNLFKALPRDPLQFLSKYMAEQGTAESVIGRRVLFTG